MNTGTKKQYKSQYLRDPIAESHIAQLAVRLSKIRNKIDAKEAIRELNEKYLGKGQAKSPKNYGATPFQRNFIEYDKNVQHRRSRKKSK